MSPYVIRRPCSAEKIRMKQGVNRHFFRSQNTCSNQPNPRHSPTIVVLFQKNWESLISSVSSFYTFLSAASALWQLILQGIYKMRLKEQLKAGALQARRGLRLFDHQAGSGARGWTRHLTRGSRLRKKFFGRWKCIISSVICTSFKSFK